jgi:hypothetical protein
MKKGFVPDFTRSRRYNLPLPVRMTLARAVFFMDEAKMKPKTIWSLLFLLALFLVALAALVAYVLQDEPLHPTAAQALRYRPSPVPPEENAYVGFAGLDAPAGSDFIQVGAENIRRGNLGLPPDASTLPEEEIAPKLKFSISKYAHSCERNITENCLEEIWAAAQNIQKLLEENDALIKRYLRIQAMPVFANTSRREFFPSYVLALNLSQLLSAKAVLDIQDGRLEEGLDFIEKDMNFYRGILASKDLNLLDAMIAVVPVRRHASLLALLYQEGRLSGQTDRVRALLTPLEDPKNIFTNAMWRERVFVIQGFDAMMHFSPQKLIETTDTNTGETQEGTYFDQLKLMLLFRPNMTLNLLDEISSLETETLNGMAIDALPAQRDVLWKNEIRPRVCTIPEDYFYCRHWKNFMGEIPAIIEHSDVVRYLLKIHDVDAHLRLLRAQLEFALATENAPETETPEAILARLGPETFNPYTGQAFEWDPETGRIGFMPAADITPEWVSVRLFSRRPR